MCDRLDRINPCACICFLCLLQLFSLFATICVVKYSFIEEIPAHLACSFCKAKTITVPNILFTV